MLYLTYSNGGDSLDKDKELQVFKLLANYGSMENDYRISVRVPRKLYDDFKAVSGNQTKTLTRLIIEYLAEHKKD